MAKDDDDVQGEKTNPTDPNTVCVGDLLAITYYTKVAYNNRSIQRIDVTDVDRDTPFNITGDALIRAATTADRFAEEVKVPRTRIARF